MKCKVLFGNCVPSGKLCDSKICVEAKNCLNVNTNVNTPTTALIAATSLLEFDTPQRLGLDGFEIHYQRRIIESGASQLGMEYVIVVRSDGQWKRTGGPDGEKVGTIPEVLLKNLASAEYHSKHKQLARKDVVLGREVFVLSAVNKGLMIEKSYALDIPVPLFIKLTYDRQTLIDEAVQIIPRQVTDDEVALTK